MSFNIIVPPLGESVVEATVARWRKREGEAVRAGETLVELETDKVNLEVGAERDGVLARIVRAEGSDVKIGDVLGEVQNANASAPPSAPAAPQRADASEATRETEPRTASDDNPFARVFEDQSKATPVAKRLAEEHKVDLSKVEASGADGRVTKGDVEAFIARQQSGRGTQTVISEEKTQIPSPKSQAPTSNLQPQVSNLQSPVSNLQPQSSEREERVR
ncbi:MAG: E3 binding domain-containing protein, partial [Chloroflexi bacterium]|nr:E3 binding domain-containing protein [Chloroflexota bacterium]